MDLDDVVFHEQVVPQVAIAVENSFDYEKTTKDRDKEAKSRLYLEEGVRAESRLNPTSVALLRTTNPSDLKQIPPSHMNSPSVPEWTDQWANASDTSLVESVKSGNHSAYSELVKRHSTLALRVAYRITQNKEDAEDAMQESLFLAYKRINSFDGRSAFATWLTRIVINSSLMILRKRRKNTSTSLDDDQEIGLQTLDPAPSPELLLVRLEKAAAVRDAVRRLPPLLRNSIEARYWKEMSTHDTAALNGVTVAAAKSRQLRARRKLRTMLDHSLVETDKRRSQ